MRLTQITGGLLILVGVIAYVTTDTSSITALFPAALGLVLLMLGLIAVAPKFRRDAVHIAVLIGLFGIIAFLDNARHLPALISGSDVERPQAVVVSALTVVILIAFLVLSIQSFRQARREREQAAKSTPVEPTTPDTTPTPQVNPPEVNATDTPFAQETPPETKAEHD